MRPFDASGVSATTSDPPIPIRAELDLQALRYNLRLLKELAGDAAVLGVVKADAYGHGVEHVVPVMREERVRIFGVANIEEAARLRALGVDERILVFGGPLPEYLSAYVAHGLDVAVTSTDVAEAVLAHPGPFRVHVKVDTGMHRLGLQAEDAPGVLAKLYAAAHVEVVGAWTHLATADEEDLAFTREQIDRFEAVLPHVRSSTLVHVANSGALAQLPEKVRGHGLVRPGGLVYGLPSSAVLAERVAVRPVLRLVSRVVRVQAVEPGETVSYGRTWRAERPTLVATIAAGYGDGIPRHLSNRGEVAIRGRRYRVAGRVCMDMLMVDLGEPGGAGAAVSAGDDVVFFGPGGPDVLEVAAAADTITYVLTVGIAPRVPRVLVS
jgi:alanine racemase